MMNNWPIEVDIQHCMLDANILNEINEHFDKLKEFEFDVVPTEIKKIGSVYQTEIKLKEGYYRVFFGEKKPGTYELSLKMDVEEPKLTDLSQYILHQHDSYKLTNKKNSIKIFSFVISSVHSFIKKVNVGVITFHSNEPKKDKVYGLLAKDTSKKIGWGLKDGYDENGTYRAFLINPNHNDNVELN